jgi:hypothetical protein
MASVYIDIDLNDVNSWELIEEIENRALCLSDSQKERVLDAISYDDAEKWKLFLAVKNKYSLLELQELFNTSEPVCSSKAQLPIAFPEDNKKGGQQ